VRGDPILEANSPATAEVVAGPCAEHGHMGVRFYLAEVWDRQFGLNPRDRVVAIFEVVLTLSAN
jgi:hypothetical protein